MESKNLEICRLCLIKIEANEEINIFSFIDGYSIKECIMEVTSIQVLMNDEREFPDKLCKQCLEKLKISYEFKLQCLRCDEMLKNGGFTKHKFDQDLSNNENKLEGPLDQPTVEIKIEDLKVEENPLENDIKVFENDEDSVEMKHVKMKRPKYFCCNQNYKNKKSFNLHKIIVHQKSTNLKCKKIAKNRNLAHTKVSSHRLDVHKEEILNWFCNICKARFPKNKFLLQHKKIENHYTEKELQCPTYLRLNPNNPERYTCELCKKSYKFKGNWTNHVNFAHKEKPEYQCKSCGKLFQTPRYVRIHEISAHSQKEKYACDECGKRFRYSDILRRHKIRRHRERQFKCETCGKAFVLNSDVIKHAVIHSDERPFTCKYCNRSYKRKDYMPKHYRVCPQVPKGEIPPLDKN